jgi:Ion channel
VTHLVEGLRVVWPIVIALITIMVSLGCATALVERWSLFEGVYFAFVSGLTIGYGDLAPKTMLARVFAVTIGFAGILLTATIAAVGVQALTATQESLRER